MAFDIDALSAAQIAGYSRLCAVALGKKPRLRGMNDTRAGEATHSDTIAETSALSAAPHAA